MADGAYRGESLPEPWPDPWRIELVRRVAQAKGLGVIPRRWVIRRAIAWINRCRRLGMDYESLERAAVALIRPANIRLMLRRFTRCCDSS